VDNMKILKKPSTLFAVFVILFGITYFNFVQYKPKAIRQLPDVKAAATSTETLGFQIPQDSDRTSINKSQDFNQVIYQTKKKKVEIQDFYKSIYSSPKWTKLSESAYKDFIITRYKMGEVTVTITTFDLNQQGTSNNTLVSLEEKRD
jgi:hypothetical protein